MRNGKVAFQCNHDLKVNRRQVHDSTAPRPCIIHSTRSRNHKANIYQQAHFEQIKFIRCQNVKNRYRTAKTGKRKPKKWSTKRNGIALHCRCRVVPFAIFDRNKCSANSNSSSERTLCQRVYVFLPTETEEIGKRRKGERTTWNRMRPTQVESKNMAWRMLWVASFFAR